MAPPMSCRQSATAANNSRSIVGSFGSFIFFRWLSRSSFKNLKTTKKNKSSADDTSGRRLHQSYRTRKNDLFSILLRLILPRNPTGNPVEVAVLQIYNQVQRRVQVMEIFDPNPVLHRRPSPPPAQPQRCCSLHLVRNRSHIGGYLLYWDKPAASASGDSSGVVGGESSGSFSINSSNTKIITPLTYKSTTRGRGTRIEEITCSQPCYDLVGTCNGLICLANDAHFSPEVPTLIWNPSVRKFVTLPLPSIAIPDTVYDMDRDDWVIPTSAFGYDSRTGDYKVLRIFSNFYRGGAAGDTPFGVNGGLEDQTS